MIFVHELAALSELIGARLPIHVENLFSRTDKSFGLLVTVEAPLHVEAVFFPRQRHCVHKAMACGATDAFVHVDTVIEEHKLRKIVDAIPFERPLTSHAFPHRLEHRRIGPDLRMAGHARFRRWQAGEGRVLNARVAIAAINSQSSNMMLMTEGSGLIERHALHRHVR